MSIPITMTKAVISGTLFGGEEFATGFWMVGNTPTTQTAANDYAANLTSLFESDALTNLKAILSTDCSYDKVTIYAYPTGGPLASFVGEDTITSGTGTSSASDLPLATSLVTTLLTGLPGRRHRGRMYWPAVGAALSDHQFVVADKDNALNGVAVFFTSVNGFSSLGDVVVLSQVGAGSVAAVTTLRVDSVPDVQRRRSASLIAADFSQASV